MILAISQNRQALVARQPGSRSREIYNLNLDRLPNEYDVPLGAELQIPADARLE